MISGAGGAAWHGGAIIAVRMTPSRRDVEVQPAGLDCLSRNFIRAAKTLGSSVPGVNPNVWRALQLGEDACPREP